MAPVCAILQFPFPGEIHWSLSATLSFASTRPLALGISKQVTLSSTPLLVPPLSATGPSLPCSSSLRTRDVPQPVKIKHLLKSSVVWVTMLLGKAAQPQEQPATTYVLGWQERGSAKRAAVSHCCWGFSTFHRIP